MILDDFLNYIEVGGVFNILEIYWLMDEMSDEVWCVICEINNLYYL